MTHKIVWDASKANQTSVGYVYAPYIPLYVTEMGFYPIDMLTKEVQEGLDAGKPKF